MPITTTRLTSDEARAFNERLRGFNDSLNPRNATERALVKEIVHASILVERARAAQMERLRANIEHASHDELEEIECLGKHLLFDLKKPTLLNHRGAFAHIGPRTSDSHVAADFHDPVLLVRRLEDSLAGCHWLLARWAELRARLEPGQGWQACHRFKAIRLLGCRPADAADRRDVAEIYFRTWTLRPDRPTAWSDLESDLRIPQHVRFFNRRWPDLIDSRDEATERQALIAIVERAIECVKKKTAVAEERADEVAQRQIDCLSFDFSDEGERLRQFEWRCDNAFSRALNEFLKIRKAARRTPPVGIAIPEKRTG